MKLQTTSLEKYIRAISGVFNFLTPKELDILSIIVVMCDGKPEITTNIKRKVSSATGHNMQVITNYISRLRKKGAIVSRMELHPVLVSKRVTIEYDGEETRDM